MKKTHQQLLMPKCTYPNGEIFQSEETMADLIILTSRRPLFIYAIDHSNHIMQTPRGCDEIDFINISRAISRAVFSLPFCDAAACVFAGIKSICFDKQ